MQNKKKIGRPPPKWLLDLAPGSYSLAEIIKISGKTKSPTRTTLKHYGATATYELQENGKNRAIYKWDGFKRE